MSAISDFFYAGGYGFYIWCSYGAAAFLMFGELIAAKQQHRTILKRLSRMARMNAAEEDE